MPSSIPSGNRTRMPGTKSGRIRKNWVRVDPTAALLSADRPRAPPTPPPATSPRPIFPWKIGSHHLTFSESYLPPWLQGGLREMRLRREQVEAGWDNLIFSYNPETQNRLAQALGFGKENQITLASSPCWPSRPAPPCSASCSSAAGRSPGGNALCRLLPQHDSGGIPRALWKAPRLHRTRRRSLPRPPGRHPPCRLDRGPLPLRRQPRRLRRVRERSTLADVITEPGAASIRLDIEQLPIRRLGRGMSPPRLCAVREAKRGNRGRVDASLVAQSRAGRSRLA